MENIFMKSKSHNTFSWASLNNIKEGRGDLGEEMPILIYRLFRYTMLDVLNKGLGTEKANDYMRTAGFLAGTEFTQNTLDLSVDFDTFIANLQKVFLEFKMGILRVESFNESTMEIILTIAQDLDCSGLPITDETICTYDEGFIAGSLQLYTGRTYLVREIDCWANGSRICRFKGTVIE